MDSQLAPCEGAPSSICKSCLSMTPESAYVQLALMRRSADKKRGPHVTWHQRHDLDPQTLSRMKGCLVCSTLMTTIHHDKTWDYTDTFELSVLSSRRATKKPGGYDWEDCPLISLLPVREFHYYSSPSGCTDLGFLAMMKAQDGGQGAPPEEAKRALDFGYIRELVSMCTGQHGETCTSTSGPRVPNLRVIDCTTSSVVDAPEGCCYLALSYVWGDQATSAVDDGGTAFKPLVRDSITVTQKLGFRYLWVDRHCIDQGDAYKHVLISRMGDVYSQAHITIVIATGTGANDRIPHLDGVKQVFDVRARGKIATRVFTHAACALGESTWASRAWTYQEAYLSRRRLIFTDEDVLFLCNHSFAAESSKVCIENTTLLRSQQSDIWKFIPAPQTETGFHLQRAQIETLKRQISDYTKKNLTYDSDSLDAFVGVLADTTKITEWDPIYQIWGIPHHGSKRSRSICLDWRHEKGARRRPGFPSWSWCGWAGEALFDKKKLTPTYREDCSFTLRLETGQRVALDEFTHQPTKPGEMPQDLLITTRVVPCRLAPDGDQVTAPARPRLVFQVDDDVFARVPVWLDDAQLSTQTQYAGVILEHELSELYVTSMLVVKAVDDHYERVGIVELHSQRETLVRWYVSNGQRPLHDGYSCEPWFCVQFGDVQYVDGNGISHPSAHFKPDKLPLQPWYRDGEVKEICLR